MSIFVALVDPIVWSPALIAAAAVNGIPWAIAQILQIKSFDYLGVSRAMPLTAGMQLVLTSVIGAFYFGEWPHAWQMGVGFAGIALIIVGAVLTTYTEAGQETTSKADIRKGVVITAISSVLYVAYATAARFFNVDSFQILLPQAMFMLAVTLVISVVVSKRDSVDGIFGRTEGVFGLKSWQNMLTGVLWSVANIAVLFSNQVNGVAVGWTLANMNLIFATLGGLFILHEKKTPKELRFVIAGMVLIAAGGIAIGATKLG
jgi:glucose uptake protein